MRKWLKGALIFFAPFKMKIASGARIVCLSWLFVSFEVFLTLCYEVKIIYLILSELMLVPFVPNLLEMSKNILIKKKSIFPGRRRQRKMSICNEKEGH